MTTKLRMRRRVVVKRIRGILQLWVDKTLADTRACLDGKCTLAELFGERWPKLDAWKRQEEQRAWEDYREGR